MFGEKAASVHFVVQMFRFRKQCGLKTTSWCSSPVFSCSKQCVLSAQCPDEVLLCFAAAGTPPRRTSWGCSPVFHSGISVFSLAERPDEVLHCFIAASSVFSQ